MNLLDHNNVREYRPRCGRIIPGTNQFETVEPSWSPPRIQIYQSTLAGRLIEWVNILLARDDLHVCAVSPATVSAGEPQYSDGSGADPVLVVTVIYQERTAADGERPLDDDGDPRWNADGTRNH